MPFEWDPAKNRSNIRKHGVRFEDTIRIFTDPNLREFAQSDDLDDEERWVAFGRADRTRLDVLMAVYTDRWPDVRRIISARHATAEETDDYHSRFYPV